MAKKQKFELDDFGFDSDLDFSLEGDPYKSVIKPNRSPVIEVLKGVRQGATSEVKSSNFFKNLVKHALPRGYGDAISLTEKSSRTLKNLYDNTQREIKPMTEDLKRTVARAIPHVEQKLPKNIADKLKEWSKPNSGSGTSMNADEARDAGIQMQLAEIFKLQSETQVRENAKSSAKDSIKEGIAFTRHRDQLSQLDAMRIGIQQVANYQTNITTPYQRKSLELQYRQYFVAVDSLEENRKLAQVVSRQLDAIAHNTALPEFSKIQKSERFEEIVRNKFLTKTADTLFGKRGGFVDRIGKNAAALMREKVDGFKESVRGGIEMAEQGMDAHDTMRSMAEMGMAMPSGYELGGNIVGGTIADSLGSRFGKKLGKALKKYPKVMHLGNRLEYGAKNLPQLAEEWARSNKGEGGRFTDGIVRTAKDLITMGSGVDNNIEKDSHNGLYNPGVSSKQTNKTINEIIPGFLARIYREIQVFRTGNTALELTSYNFKTGRFEEKKDIIKSIRSDIFDERSKQYTNEKLEALLAEIDPESTLTPEQKKYLKEYMIKSNLKNGSSSKKKMSDVDSYTGNARKHGTVYASLFEKHFSDDTIGAKQLSFGNKFSELGSDIPDARAIIQNYTNLGYLPILEDMGIVEPKTGAIDTERLTDFYLSMEKQETKKITPYRFGKKNAPHTPSQPIQRNFTTIVNPGSTSNQQQSQPAQSPTNNTEIVHAIVENSAKTASELMAATLLRIEQMLHVGIPSYAGGSPEETSKARQWMDLSMKDLGKRAFGVGSSILKKGKEFVAKGRAYGATLFGKAGAFATKTFDTLKEKVGQLSDIYVFGEQTPRLLMAKLRNGDYRIRLPDGSLGGIIRSIKDIKGEIVDVTTGEVVLSVDEIKKAFIRSKVGSILIQSLGAAKNAVLKFGNFLNTKATNVYSLGLGLAKEGFNFLKRKLDEPQDVYIHGKPNPVLLARTMKAGGYFSRITGNPIYTPKDIDGVVLDDQGSVVLTAEELATGLLDKNGNPLRTGLGRITGMVKDRLHQVKNFGKRAFSFAKDTALNLFQKGKEPLGSFNLKGINIGISSGTNNILLQIRNMLNDRLPGERTQFDDSTLVSSMVNSGASISSVTSMLKNKAMSAIPKVKEKVGNTLNSIQGMFGGMMGKLKGFGSRIKSFISKLTPGEGMLASGMMGMGELLKEIRDRLPKKPGLFGGVGATAGAGGILDTLTGGASSAAGNIAGDVAGGAAAGAAGTGLWNKTKHYGKKAIGGLWKATKGIGGLLAGGLGLGSLSGAASAIGSGAMAVGGALATGAGTLLTGLGAIISSPVVLATLAVAAVAAGSYYGYKYLTKKGLTSFSKVRYAQYGFIPTDKDHLEAVFGLEAKLLPGVVYKGGVAGLDDSKIKVKDVIEGFGIDKGNNTQLTNWIVWFTKRFKPVYLTHLTALKSVAEGKELDDLPSLSAEAQKKYITIAKWPNGPYDITTSPFPNLPELKAGDKEVNALVEVLEAEIDKGAKDNKPSVVPIAAPVAATAAATIMGTVPDKQVAAVPQAAISSGFKTASLTGATVSAQIVGGSTSTFVGTVPLALNSYASGKLDALSCIRFKSYGLVEMEIDKLQLIDALERLVEKDITYTKIGAAKWEGSLDSTLAAMGTAFGVQGTRNKDAYNWISWFTGRFIPVFLNYLSAINAVGGKKGLSAGNTLTPKQELDVAMAIYSTRTQSDTRTIPVWEASDTPWPNYTLNGDSKSVTLNLQGLKDKVSSTKLSETMGKQEAFPDDAKKTLATTLSSAKEAGAKEDDSNKSFFGKAGDVIKNGFKSMIDTAANSARTVGGAVVDSAKWVGDKAASAATSVANTARELVGMGKGTGGAVDSIPSPKGEGSWANLKDTILAAAKMVGVDEKLMATMAAIESGFKYSVKAGTSSATGLYQFISSTWNTMVKKYGAKYGIGPGTPPTDPRANALMGAEFLKENQTALSSVVKRKLTDTDLYIAHFMGAAGAKKFLTADPSAIAANLMPDAARANTSIFYSKDGRPLTVAEVYNVINGRVRNKGKEFGLDSGSENIVSATTPKAASNNNAPSGAGSGVATGITSTDSTKSAVVPSSPYAVASTGPNSASSKPASATSSVVPPSIMPTQSAGDRVAQVKSSKEESPFGNAGKVLEQSLAVQQETLLTVKALLKVVSEGSGLINPNPKRLVSETTDSNSSSGEIIKAPKAPVSMAKKTYS